MADATDDDEFFVDYVPSTVDPGAWITILTISYVIFVAVSIFPLVWLGRKWKKRRRKMLGAKDDMHKEAVRAPLLEVVEQKQAECCGQISALATTPSDSRQLQNELPAATSPRVLWKAAIDPNTGKTYYYNKKTKESRWDPPPELSANLIGASDAAIEIKRIASGKSAYSKKIKGMVWTPRAQLAETSIVATDAEIEVAFKVETSLSDEKVNKPSVAPPLELMITRPTATDAKNGEKESSATSSYDAIESQETDYGHTVDINQCIALATTPSDSRQLQNELPAASSPHALWKAAIDPNSGKTYYYNKKTKETCWEPPPELSANLLGASDAAIEVKRKASGGMHYSKRTKGRSWAKSPELSTNLIAATNAETRIRDEREEETSLERPFDLFNELEVESPAAANKTNEPNATSLPAAENLTGGTDATDTDYGCAGCGGCGGWKPILRGFRFWKPVLMRGLDKIIDPGIPLRDDDQFFTVTVQDETGTEQVVVLQPPAGSLWGSLFSKPMRKVEMMKATLRKRKEALACLKQPGTKGEEQETTLELENTLIMPEVTASEVPDCCIRNDTSHSSQLSDDDDDDESTYDDYDWKELPNEAVAAAEVLGYNQRIWDSGGAVTSEEMDWEELSEEERLAAIKLGYNKAKWDDEDAAGKASVPPAAVEHSGTRKKPATLEHSETYNEGGFFDDYDWSELPKHVKAAAKILGYDRRSWDFGGKAPCDDKDWEDLTAKEKSAASTLGYNETFWNHEAKHFDSVQHAVRGWDTFARVSRFDRESRRILRTAAPFTFEAMLETVLGALVAAMISKQLGSTVFTAYAVVEVCLGITGSFADGIEEAAEALIAQAIGMTDFFMAGQYAQLTTFIWLLVDVPAYIFWIFFVDNIILWLGLGEDIAGHARLYVPVVVLSNLLSGIAECVSGLLRCDGKATQAAVIDSIFHVLEVTAIGVAISHFSVGLVGVAWIQVLSAILYGIFMAVLLSWRGWLDVYKRGLFGKSSLKNWNLVKGVLKVSLPLSLGHFLSHGEWEILTFLAANMGPAEVAAWFIAGAIWEIFEYAPEGISSAAVIRIGIHLGKANPQMAKISAYKSLLYSAAWSSSLTILFIVFSDKILFLFTEDETLLAMLQSLVIMIASGNVIMCLGSDAWHIMTAQSRTKLATKIFFFGTWCITLPLSAYFVLSKNYNLQALGSSVIIGYATIALVLLYLVFTSNWAKISMKIIAKANESAMLVSSNKEKGSKDTDVSDDYTVMTDDTDDDNSDFWGKLNQQEA